MAKIDLKDLKDLKKLENISGIRKDEILDKAHKNQRRTREAFLPQSKYSVVVSAFTRKELIHLQSLIRREEVYRQEAYKIIHEHIVSTSLGDLTLKEFLENTSFLDLDTLSFLMYTATFRDKGTYTFECLNPECEIPIDIQLNNESLIKINNSELYDSMRDEALKKDYDLETLIKDEEFFINKKTYLKLDDSKFIVVLSEPSLAEDAISLRFSKDKRMEGDIGLLTALECIDEIRIPVSEEEEIVIDNKDEILTQLTKLSFYDQKEIIDESENIMFGTVINYQIDEVKCPHCGDVYTDLPISMSNILFYLIYAEV